VPREQCNTSRGVGNGIRALVNVMIVMNTQIIGPLFSPILGGQCNVTAEVMNPVDGGSVYGSR
jgi:hypothetical protein